MKEDKTTIIVRTSEGLKNNIQKMADKEDRSLNNMINQILQRAVDGKGK